MPLQRAEPLGSILLRKGVLTRDQLESALAQQADDPRKLGAILIAKGLLPAEEVARGLAEQLGLEYVELDRIELPPEVTSLVPSRLAARFRAVPLRRENGRLVVAVADPSDLEAQDLLQQMLGTPVKIALATDAGIEAAIERYYNGRADSVASVLESLDESEFLILYGDEGAHDPTALETMANDAPIIRLVNLLLTQAAQAGATDIHLEPFADRIKVRYRLDGLLYEVDAPPRRLYPAVISRIKLMAGMDITEKRLPQDGRIRMRLAEQDLDLRVAVAPTLHGESAVLRILNRQSIFLSLAELGLSPQVLAKFQEAVERPHGMVLVTGLTGSGKTTTLYAVLSKLNIAGRKIITIEDPVEYELEGVVQIQANPKVNFGFAQGVRTIVRHDPDVILIGEIRDRETAEVAIQSALTGHLVFSTLHTNDAAGTFTRLLDMGIEEYLVASTVRGVLAQRLVRRLCPACRTSRQLSREERARLGQDIPARQEVGFPVGCAECRQIGYRGQIGLFEFLPASPAVEELIMARAGSNRLREQAISDGMTDLRRDGVDKIVAGITSPGEVLRVTQS